MCDIAFFRSVACTQKEETVSDTSQLDSMWFETCLARSRKHGGATRQRTYGDTEAILNSRFAVPRAVASDCKRRWCQLPRGLFLLPRMPRDRFAERVQKLTTCRAAFCLFPTRQARGNLQVTCDMSRIHLTHAVLGCVQK